MSYSAHSPFSTQIGAKQTFYFNLLVREDYTMNP